MAFHVTEPLLNIPPEDALWKVRLVGNSSVTITFAAMDGPLFVTKSV
jgi:hypothetical protein